MNIKQWIITLVAIIIISFIGLTFETVISYLVGGLTMLVLVLHDDDFHLTFKKGRPK